MRRIALRENSTGRGLMLVSFALLALGVVMVHSAVASVAQPGPWHRRVDVRHTIFAALALMVLLTAWRVNYRWLNAGRRLPVPAAAMLAMALLCGCLVFVPGLGHAVGGRSRWIRLGYRQFSITFQPSELIKLAMLVFLAAWLSRPRTDVRSLSRTFVPAVGVILVCMAAVIGQDFGAGVLIGVLGLAVMLLAGADWFSLLPLAAGACGGFYFLVARDPRRWARIAAMLDPWSASNAAAYQPRQSIIAITSGGWFGRGVGNGISKLGFLPEDSTDFIFSVYCEEWGLIGAMLLLGLLLVWIWHARRAAVRTEDRFGALLAGSIGLLIAFQAIMHIAVDLVMIPPTGMGFPFVSAGGTRLLVMAADVALMVSATAHRSQTTPNELSADMVADT